MSVRTDKCRGADYDCGSDGGGGHPGGDPGGYRGACAGDAQAAGAADAAAAEAILEHSGVVGDHVHHFLRRKQSEICVSLLKMLGYEQEEISLL